MQNFNQQGRLYGLWKPLSAATRNQRAKQGFNPARPILERTGRLKRGFKSYVVNDRLAKVTNDVEYAAYHQNGTGKMPQRKIVGITGKSNKAIALTFAQFIAGQIRQYFYK
jgi:phage gpG-like protein